MRCLDTSAKVLATVAEVDISVLTETVGVLDATLGLSSLPLIVAEQVEPSGLNARLLKSTLVKVRVRALVEVIAAFAASVELLTALDIGVETSSVLGLAGVGAGVGLLIATVRRARVGVGISVELEGVLREVALQVVAGNKRKLNTANGVTRAVTPDAGAGLRANVGGLRSARGRGRRSGGGSASGSTRVNTGGGLDIVSTRGSVVVEAASLATVATTRASGGTVTLKTITPLGKIETVENSRPASVLEARSNVLSTVVVGSLAAVLVLEVGNRGSTPVTALILAGVGNDNSRSAHSRAGSGGARGSGGSSRRRVGTIVGGGRRRVRTVVSGAGRRRVGTTVGARGRRVGTTVGGGRRRVRTVVSGTGRRRVGTTVGARGRRVGTVVCGRADNGAQGCGRARAG